MLYSIHDGRERGSAMIVRPRYYFRKELKNEFLKGMKLNYICEQIGMSYSYLSSVMRGKNAVDDYVITKIMAYIGYTNKEIKELKDKYFVLRDE